jgi:hypothetical protein
MRKYGKSYRRKTPLPLPGPFHVLGLALAIFFAVTGTLLAGTAQEQTFAQRAQAAYLQAQAKYQSQTNNPILAWEFARAAYDWGTWTTNKSERAAIARDGVTACQQALSLTNCAALHYYMGLNLGQLAQSEMLHGLRLVREMEREWQAAADLDAHFDFAGPERSLGLLYRDAPGWPLSLGSRQKALESLQNASMLASQDPENILNLAESYLKWGDPANARRELAVLDALWPKAQKSLTGEAWEPDCYDWSKRRDAVRQKLGQS